MKDSEILSLTKNELQNKFGKDKNFSASPCFENESFLYTCFIECNRQVTFKNVYLMCIDMYQNQVKYNQNLILNVYNI